MRYQGAQVADGEYIVYVDADDEIEKSYSKKLQEKAIIETYDIIYVLIREEKCGGQECLQEPPSISNELDISDRRKLSISDYIFRISGFAFRKEFINKNKIFIDGQNVDEDCIAALYPYIAKKIGIIYEPLYYWHFQKNSMCRQEVAHHRDRVNVFLYTYDYAKHIGLIQKYPLEEIEYMIKNRMNIVVGTSKEYAKYVSVMLESLYENNPKSQIYVYICIEESLEENADVLKNIAQKHGGFLEFLTVKTDLKIKEQIKRATNYETTINFNRLQAIDLLPEDVDRFLMLGADTLVLGDISDFYNQDFEDNYIVMCTDYFIYEPLGVEEEWMSYFLQEMNRRKIDNIKRYGNSDVVLINLEIKKIFKFNEMVESIIINKFPTLEQDYLSFEMNKYIKFINPYVYNYQKIGDDVDPDIKIVHFACRDCKPWVIWDTKKIGAIWLDYAKRTYGSESILEEYREYKKANKFRYYYNLLNHWMDLKEQNGNIFDQYNYKEVAIYGYGNLGKHLLHDIHEKNICCKSIFDKNIENTQIFTNEMNVFLEKVGSVDKIIVTPIFIYDAICEELCKMGIEKNRIINLEDMLN